MNIEEWEALLEEFRDQPEVLRALGGAPPPAKRYSGKRPHSGNYKNKGKKRKRYDDDDWAWGWWKTTKSEEVPDLARELFGSIYHQPGQPQSSDDTTP